MREGASAFLVRSVPSDVPLASRKSLQHGPGSINRIPNHRAQGCPLFLGHVRQVRVIWRGREDWLGSSEWPFPSLSGSPSGWGGPAPSNARIGPAKAWGGADQNWGWGMGCSTGRREGGPPPAESEVENNSGSSLNLLESPVFLVQSCSLPQLQFPLNKHSDITATRETNSPI